MAISTSDILDVLGAYDIRPFEDDWEEIDLPEIGEIEEGEAIYSTSVAEVFRRDDVTLEDPSILDIDDPRLREWWEEIEGFIEEPNGGLARRVRERVLDEPAKPPEPHCAWYCPIHFFGHGWGIYIRENCIFSHAIDIASFVHWPYVVGVPRREIARQLLRSAFYVFFLHEQFHHKVESLGFRLLVSTGSDRYRPYKANVYRRTILTPDCLEESLANAESYRRLGERRYVQRVDAAILEGLRDYLEGSLLMQPPGYREGLNFLTSTPYRRGLYSLQSQILDGVFPPTTPEDHWTVAPNMIKSLANISDEIYVVLPRGARPLFSPTTVDPGATVSTRALRSALTRHYGYQPVQGGKGSHVKLKKPGAPTIILPGNRSVLSPGILKHALDAIGGYPISRLPDLLDGRLAAHV